jgi:hypothetical protein
MLSRVTATEVTPLLAVHWLVLEYLPLVVALAFLLVSETDLGKVDLEKALDEDLQADLQGELRLEKYLKEEDAVA